MVHLQAQVNSTIFVIHPEHNLNNYFMSILKNMNTHRQKRATPFVALLVIILGIVVIIVSISLDIPQYFIASTPQNDLSSETTSFAISDATGDYAPVTEYEFHRSRDELQVALYHIEAESTLNGWTAQNHIRAGNLWRDMGDLGRALPHWEAANASEPNANLLRQIAEIYLERGEWSIAWQRIQTLLNLAPNDTWSLYNGGLLLSPSDPTTAYGYLGQVAALGNSFSENAQTILDVIGESETNADIILRVGAELTALEEYSLAENAYQYAADLYYPFPEATAYVGLMRILQGKNGEAWISEAITLASTNADVQYITGVYWRSAGEYLLSEDALIEAVLLEPDNPTFYAELGNTYRGMGNRLDAEIWLQTAVIISDNNPIMIEALNSFYADDTFLVTQPDIDNIPNDGEQDPSVLSANGWALYVSGDIDGGLVLIDQALAIQSDNPRALFDKARIFLETQRTSSAIPLLQQLANGNSVFAGPAQGLLDREQAN